MKTFYLQQKLLTDMHIPPKVYTYIGYLLSSKEEKTN